LTLSARQTSWWCASIRRAGHHHRTQRREIDKLKQDVQSAPKREVHIDIQEVHRPELDATLVAESIALQLEKRVAFRARCAKRWIRRCASVAKASRCVWQVG